MAVSVLHEDMLKLGCPSSVVENWLPSHVLPKRTIQLLIHSLHIWIQCTSTCRRIVKKCVYAQ